MVTADQVRQDVRQFLAEDCGVDASKLDDRQELFDSGILESVDALKVMLFLEERYGVRVPAFEFSLERFSSLSNIGDLVIDLAGR